MQKKPRNILAIRLSAMGDVAMTIPTIAAVISQYPNANITILTNERLQPLFEGIERVKVVGISPKTDYRGFWGILQLFLLLKKEGQYYAVADLHDVLRTKLLRFFFWITGTKVAKINKSRKECKALTKRAKKPIKPLITVQQRYMNVFAGIGLPVRPQAYRMFAKNTPLDNATQLLVGEKESIKWVGIAPFAQHKGKIYPQELMEQVIAQLSSKGSIKVLLFGNGPSETPILEKWQANYTNVLSLAGKASLINELKLMTHLDCMISMDSANMHLASLVQTPVVSVWGQTHPYAGFFGDSSAENHVVQIDNLPCRPCSIYGNRDCYIGGYPCLYNIKPETIVNLVDRITT